MKSVFYLLLILIINSACLSAQQHDYQLEVLDLNTIQDSKADISGSFPTPNGIYYYLETEDSYDELYLFKGDSLQLVFRERQAEIHFVTAFNSGALFSINRSSSDGYAIFINDLDGTSINLPIVGRINRANLMEETQRLVFLTDRKLLGSISGRDNLIDTLTTDVDSPGGALIRYAATTKRIVYQSGEALISSDGTSSRIDTILELASASASTSELLVSDGKVFFSSIQGLYTTNETFEGVLQLTSDTEQDELLVVNNIGKIYPFKDGVAFTATSPNEGRELFYSDGTPQGTRIVIDANPGDAYGASSSSPVINVTRDYIMFLVWYPGAPSSRLLAISDGTEEGTRFFPDIASLDDTPSVLSLNLTMPVTDDGDIYFVAKTDETGRLYGINETINDGAPFLVEQAPFFNFSTGHYTSLGDAFLYTVNKHDTNENILTSIESPISPVLKIDTFFRFSNLINSREGISYFTHQPDLNTTATELFRTDGTIEGTRLVKSIPSSSIYAPSLSLNRIDSTLYFSVDDDTNLEAIYTTDGTEEGTTEVADFYPHTIESNIGSFYARNNTLFITGFSGNGSETITYSSSGDIESTEVYPFVDNLGLLGEHNQYTLYFKSGEEFILKRGLLDPGTSITMPAFTVFGDLSSYSREAAFFNGSFYLIRSDYIANERYNISLLKINVNTGTVESILDSEDVFMRGQPRYSIYNFQGKISFLWYEGDMSESIWLSNGTPQGTERLVNLEGLVNRSTGLDTELIVDKNTLVVSRVTLSLDTIKIFAFNGTTGSRIASATLPGRDYLVREVSVKDRKVILLMNGNIISLDVIEGTGEVLSPAHRVGNTLLPDHRMVFLRPVADGEYETWVTDGTIEGTTLLVRDAPLLSSDDLFFVFDKNLVYNYLDTFYVYNLEEENLNKVTFNELRRDQYRFLLAYQGRLYFYAPNLVYGREIHYIDFNTPQSSTSITGDVFSDENNNNQFDQEESGIPNSAVLIEGTSNVLAYANTDGRYSSPLAEGVSYVASVIAPPCWELSTTPGSYAFDAEQDTVYSAHFGLTSISNAASIRPLLSLARPRCGFTIPAWVTLYNDGCNDLEFTTVEVSLPEGVNMVSADTPPVISGNVLSWETGPLSTGQSRVIYLELQMPGEEANGEDIVINLNASATYGFDNTIEAEFLFNQSLSCAIDPNDKQVDPAREEPSNSNYTQNDETLTYTIRFQNTGTDTAFNVRLEDQLSNQMDFLTFKPIASSHDYRASMDESGLVKVYFDGIMLPDSSTNQTLSNGFFTFDVNTRPALEDFTPINNTAGIFFDFNQPVITNTVTSTIVEFIDEDEDGFPFYEECDDENPDVRPDAEEIFGNGIDEDCDGSDSPVSTTTPLSGQLAIFPNPAHQQLTLSFSDSRELVAQLYDLLGREQAQLVFRSSGDIQLSQLPAGTYLLKVTDAAKGETSIRRVIRR